MNNHWSMICPICDFSILEMPQGQDGNFALFVAILPDPIELENQFLEIWWTNRLLIWSIFLFLLLSIQYGGVWRQCDVRYSFDFDMVLHYSMQMGNVINVMMAAN